MPRGDFRHREPKKTKKDKKKLSSLVELLPQTQQGMPERILPKRKPSSDEEEEKL